MTDVLVKVNGWDVLFTTTLLVFDEQEIEILLTPEDPLIVKLIFTETASNPVTLATLNNPPKKADFEIRGSKNEAYIHFSNWSNRLGIANSEPVEFAADSQGRVITVMCAATQIGKCHKVCLQFARGPKP